MSCGPFHEFARFIDRHYPKLADPAAQSDTLWTLGNVLVSAGDMGRAMETAKEQQSVDVARGAERDAAARGGFNRRHSRRPRRSGQALRIRARELLPVYEKLGDIRQRR